MKCLATQHWKFIKALPKICKNKKELNKTISLAKNKEILAFSEICHNLLKGHIPCSPAKKKILTNHVKDIRFIANRKNSLKKKKKLIVKKGSGFILPLIPFALAAITKIFSK